MRGTWIILLITVVAGVGMYFYFQPKAKSTTADTIAFTNTPDSIVEKMQVFIADDPKEVMYLDSVWMQSDSTPLRKVMAGVEQDTMSKNYSNITLYFAYDNRAFYDLELVKPDPKLAYSINLEVKPENADSLIVQATILPNKGDGFQFQDRMMKMASRFVVTYNHKLPQEPTDSTAIQGHEPNKTVTILRK